MPQSVVDTVRPWADKIKIAARRYGLDPATVAAVVVQESGGNPWAIRVERGFWKRYFDGIVALVKGTASRADDRWVEYPDIFAASYGLMQIMLPVAIENGFVFVFPTELLDPATNLDVGCRVLDRKIRKAGSEYAGLLAYNGGGNPNYPNEVLSKKREIVASEVLP